jgi:hypothetical protein
MLPTRDEAIAAIFGKSAPFPAAELARLRLESAWPDIAGSIYKHCQPAGVRDERLLVRVQKPIYKQEIQLLQRDILKRASAATGLTLTRLTFEDGPFEAPAENPSAFSAARESSAPLRTENSKDDPGDAGRSEILEGLRKLL